MWGKNEKELVSFIPHTFKVYESLTINYIIYFSVRLKIKNKCWVLLFRVFLDGRNKWFIL